eukprot:7356522-Prorocentrum_lima.AAC.1
MSREALSAVINDAFPELGHPVPYLLEPVHSAYWMDGNGQRHSLRMATGVPQGCPFSMGIFSVIIGTLADLVASQHMPMTSS